MSDDRQRVYVSPSDETVGTKRAEGTARSAGAAARDADVAAQEAADDAALAQVTADDAYYEATFGSVAVGRLVAGTLAVGEYIESQGGTWRIDADGSAVFADISLQAGNVTIDSGGISVLEGSYQGEPSSRVEWSGGQHLEGFDGELWMYAPGGINLSSFLEGGDAFFWSLEVGQGRSPVVTVATAPTETNGATWTGANGSLTSYVDGHQHNIGPHHHTITF